MRDISKVTGGASSSRSRKSGKPTRRGRNRKVRQKQQASGAQTKRRRAGVRWAFGLVSVAAALFTVVGVAVGGWYGWQALRQNERFRVHEIQLRGQKRFSRADMKAYAGVERGTPLLGLDLDVVAGKLEGHPWVDRALVRRRLPDGLRVRIEEHEAAVLVSLGGLYVANQRGEVFKRYAPSDALVLPVVTGLTRQFIRAEPDVAAQRIRAAIALHTACREHADTLGRLDELHWDTHLGWSVISGGGELLPSGTRLHLGKQPAERLPVAEAAARRLREQGYKPRAIWADAQVNPNRIHVALQPANDSSKEQTLIAKAR